MIRQSFRRLGASLLLASLTATSAMAGVGEYRCRFGMAEAGPDCPMCHGSEAPVGTTSLGQACCEFVEQVPAQVVMLAAKEHLIPPSAAALLTHYSPDAVVSYIASAPDVDNLDIGHSPPKKPLILRL